MKNDFDYVIIGAGSAGCVLAARLSEDPKVRVLLVEAGGKDISPWFHIPIGYSKTIGDPRYDWSFQSGPEPGLGGRILHYARGKALGGSSSINGLAWTLGSRHDYDRWRDLGCGDWGYDAVAPYLRKLETFPEGGPLRGKSGPVQVKINPGLHECSDMLMDSCQAYGLPAIADANAPDPVGISRMQINVGGGLRQSAARAYLGPARGRSNLEILTDAAVGGLVIENGAATGITVVRNNQRETLSAHREVILSAGSINSPLLLEASGVGDPTRLKALGIDVRAAVPQVGENARDHYMVTSKLRLKTLSSRNGSDGGVRAAISGLRYLLNRKGPLSEPPTELIGFARLLQNDGPPDVEIFASPLTYGYKQMKGRIQAVMDKAPGMSFSFYQCYPRSVGHVHLSDGGKPSIVCNYLTDPFDQEVFVAAMRAVRAISKLKPLADFVTEELTPGPVVSDDAEALLDHGRKTGNTTFHIVGTCRMGDDDKAVVDQKLRVKGVRRLRVVDASVMPNIIGTHTNAPTMMIAERAAEFITTAAR